jgi:signal transduction histidine kinase
LLVGGRPASQEEDFAAQGEELLCHSMLGNLIANAVEASPEGGSLQVELSRQEGGVLLVVRNHGVVPQDMRQRFFEKYATSGKTRGTGLGTYSARLIAQAHGGDISMRTDDAAGTAVTITLPGA